MSVLDGAASANPVGLGLAALGRPAYINIGRDQDLFKFIEQLRVDSFRAGENRIDSL